MKLGRVAVPTVEFDAHVCDCCAFRALASYLPGRRQPPPRRIGKLDGRFAREHLDLRERRLKRLAFGIAQMASNISFNFLYQRHELPKGLAARIGEIEYCTPAIMRILDRKSVV